MPNILSNNVWCRILTYFQGSLVAPLYYHVFFCATVYKQQTIVQKQLTDKYPEVRSISTLSHKKHSNRSPWDYFVRKLKRQNGWDIEVRMLQINRKILEQLRSVGPKRGCKK